MLHLELPGVREGDHFGPLLFALMFQPTPFAAQESAADALVTACHDDKYIQGSEEAVIVGAARIMSRHACLFGDACESCTPRA